MPSISSGSASSGPAVISGTSRRIFTEFVPGCRSGGSARSRTRGKPVHTIDFYQSDVQLYPFPDGGIGVTECTAEGGESVFYIRLVRFHDVVQGDDDSGSRLSEWVSQGQSAAPDVGLFEGGFFFDAQFPHTDQ